jgi:hypothetical protein
LVHSVRNRGSDANSVLRTGRTAPTTPVSQSYLPQDDHSGSADSARCPRISTRGFRPALVWSHHTIVWHSRANGPFGATNLCVAAVAQPRPQPQANVGSHGGRFVRGETIRSRGLEHLDGQSRIFRQPHKSGSSGNSRGTKAGKSAASPQDFFRHGSGVQWRPLGNALVTFRTCCGVASPLLRPLDIGAMP